MVSHSSVWWKRGVLQDKNKFLHDQSFETLLCYLMSESFLLCVDDLGQAVSPHAALGPAAGLEDALLPRLQRPHSQTHEKLLSGDTQQISSPLQEV